jgi:hypothetical protein
LNSARSELENHYVKHRDLCYGTPPREKERPEPERPLPKNIHLIGNFLKYWSWHNNHVLEAIPRERLLVVPTRRLSNSGSRIADFLGVERNRILDPGRKNSAPSRHDALEYVDERYIEALISEYCSETIKIVSERIPEKLGWPEA